MVPSRKKSGWRTYRRWLAAFTRRAKRKATFNKSLATIASTPTKCRASQVLNIDGFIYRKTYLREVTPFREKIATYDETTLFAVIEFLHDFIAKGVSGRYH